MTMLRSLPFRPVLAVLLGATLVMVPGGIIYSFSFIALNALVPALGFTQASTSAIAVAWRILVCLLCAAAAGYLTQTMSKERASYSVGILASACLLCGLMDFHSSGLYNYASTSMRLVLATSLAIVIYASGRLTAFKTPSTLHS